MPSLRPSPFLRQALLADAVTSGAAGLLMTLGAGFLDRLLGLPTGLLHAAGLSLLPFAALLAYLANRDSLPAPVGWAVVLANALWVADSFLLLATGWIEPTPVGSAFVIGQALVVAVYAELQYVGLRRSTAAAA